MRIEIGRVSLYLGFSFASLVTLMLLLCDEEIVLLSLFSALFHEGGHLFFILLFTESPLKIVFGAFGMRIERENTFPGYKREAIIALGGIIGNGILSLFGFCLHLLTKSSFSFKLFAVNVFLAVFNLIPIKALDCGRTIEILLEAFTDYEKSERIFSFVSVITCFVLSAGCVIYNLYFGLNVSFITVTVYLIFISIFKEFKK